MRVFSAGDVGELNGKGRVCIVGRGDERFEGLLGDESMTKSASMLYDYSQSSQETLHKNKNKFVECEYIFRLKNMV